MSLVFNMVGGGGAAGGAELPAIYVTYPAGSVCTCTNGVKTFTAKDTTGFWLFAGLEVGTWTVTTTDPSGENAPKRQTVEITTEGQIVSVELSYRLWLFKDGDLCEAVTGGWISTYAIPDGRSRGPTSIGEVLTCDATDFYDCAILGTDNAIDLTKINTLYVETDDSSYGVQLRLAVGATKSIANITDMAAKVDFTSAGIQGLDVSALSGNYYVSVSATSSGNATSLLNAEKVWGE